MYCPREIVFTRNCPIYSKKSANKEYISVAECIGVPLSIKSVSPHLTRHNCYLLTDMSAFPSVEPLTFDGAPSVAFGALNSTASLNFLAPEHISSLPQVWKQKIEEWTAQLVTWQHGEVGENVKVEDYVEPLQIQVCARMDDLEKFKVSPGSMFTAMEREAICSFVISAVYDADVKGGMLMFPVGEPEDPDMTSLPDIYAFYESTFRALGGPYIFLAFSHANIKAYVEGIVV